MISAPISSPLPLAGGDPSPKDAPGAARQFEALLLAQMMRTTRESAEDDDSTAETMFDIAGQQFAQLLANNGGLGLSSLITKGLGSQK